MKQGELSGILKELGYTEDQVNGPFLSRVFRSSLTQYFASGLQVLIGLAICHDMHNIIEVVKYECMAPACSTRHLTIQGLHTGIRDPRERVCQFRSCAYNDKKRNLQSPHDLGARLPRSCPVFVATRSLAKAVYCHI